MYASQLAQSRPSGTTAENLFTATDKTDITRIVICNTTGATAKYSIYHDDDGSTFDESTALYFEVDLAANSSIELADFVRYLTLPKDAQIGVKTSVASALTFTLYGGIVAQEGF